MCGYGGLLSQQIIEVAVRATAAAIYSERNVQVNHVGIVSNPLTKCTLYT